MDVAIARLHDSTEARACMVRLLQTLDAARIQVGHTALPATLSPQAVGHQIDALDDLLGEAQLELAAARQACARTGRGALCRAD